jgi:hypothetical protein
MDDDEHAVWKGVVRKYRGYGKWKKESIADLIVCKIMNEAYIYTHRIQFNENRLETRKTNTLYLLCAITQLTEVSPAAETTNSNSGDRSK